MLAGTGYLTTPSRLQRSSRQDKSPFSGHKVPSAYGVATPTLRVRRESAFG